MVNRCLLFFVAAVVRIIQGKFLQGREVTFNPIQPGGVCRCPVELDLVRGRIAANLCLPMKCRIVQDDMQHFSAGGIFGAAI